MESIIEKPRPRCYVEYENYINIDVYDDGSYIYDFDPFKEEGIIEHLCEKKWCDGRLIVDVIRCMRYVALKQNRQLSLDQLIY